MTDQQPQLPAHLLAAALATAASDTEQRAEALVEDRGRREHLVDGSPLGLISVRLTDLGPVGA